MRTCRRMSTGRVAPCSASSGVSRSRVQAMFSINSSEVQGELPGLQSVASATVAWEKLRDARGATTKEAKP